MRKDVVPPTMDGQMMYHAVSGNVKHALVIACMSAAGESLTPYIATPRLFRKFKSSSVSTAFVAATI
jgi:hypothetical protein